MESNVLKSLRWTFNWNKPNIARNFETRIQWQGPGGGGMPLSSPEEPASDLMLFFFPLPNSWIRYCLVHILEHTNRTSDYVQNSTEELILVNTFDEGHEFVMFDLSALHIDLQGQEQGEGHLVLLVESACRVLVDLERHVLDDVHDSLGRDRRLLRSVRMIRENKKLHMAFSFEMIEISGVHCRVSGDFSRKRLGAPWIRYRFSTVVTHSRCVSSETIVKNHLGTFSKVIA